MILTPVQIEIIKRFNELPMVMDRRGLWREGDLFIEHDTPHPTIFSVSVYDCEIHNGSGIPFLWVPPVDNLTNMVRSLWEMLDVDMWVVARSNDGDMFIQNKALRIEDCVYWNDDPTIAMMQAIIWQEDQKNLDTTEK